MAANFRIVVPARYAPTRLPAKPLADIGGKPMIVRVLERVKDAGGSETWVATDHEGVRDAVQAAGGAVVMTRPHHPSGVLNQKGRGGGCLPSHPSAGIQCGEGAFAPSPAPLPLFGKVSSESESIRGQLRSPPPPQAPSPSRESMRWWRRQTWCCGYRPSPPGKHHPWTPWC